MSSASETGPTPPIVYAPPAPDVLEHFASSVCQELGAAFAEPDVVAGFTHFMKVVAQAQANHLNRLNADAGLRSE